MMRCARPSTLRRSLTRKPLASSASTSSTSTSGLTTTPLPMVHTTPSRTMPEGTRCSLNSSSPTLTVWPALLPPEYRDTYPTSDASASQTLPLPSSPQASPSTTVAVKAPPPRRYGWFRNERGNQENGVAPTGDRNSPSADQGHRSLPRGQRST